MENKNQNDFESKRCMISNYLSRGSKNSQLAHKNKIKKQIHISRFVHKTNKQTKYIEIFCID